MNSSLLPPAAAIASSYVGGSEINVMNQNQNQKQIYIKYSIGKFSLSLGKGSKGALGAAGAAGILGTAGTVGIFGAFGYGNNVEFSFDNCGAVGCVEMTIDCEWTFIPSVKPSSKIG